MAKHTQYLYRKGLDPVLDAEFSQTAAYSKVRPGSTHLYWRYGLRQYAIPLNQVQRIFRRVEPVYGKLCCGGKSFIIEWLVLILHDGSELVIHIGDDVQKQAEALLEYLKQTHPEIQYGKVYEKNVS